MGLREIQTQPAGQLCGCVGFEQGKGAMQAVMPLALLQLTAAEVRRVEQAEAARGQLVDTLDRLKQRVANVE